MTVTIRDERMSDVDAVVWAIEREPRLRTTIAALVQFDGRLDQAALRHRVERTARRIPRLRQRVAAEPLGLAPPTWTADPDFRLSFHLRRCRLGSGGTERDLLDLVRDLIVQPFDRARPLWEVTVIDGLRDGATAVLLKTHHAVSDGVGGVELMLELFDLEPSPTSDTGELPPEPMIEAGAAVGHSHSPLLDEVRRETLRSVRSAASWLELAGASAADDVLETARRLGETLGSAGRMFRPEPTPRSPLMRERSAGLEIARLEVRLDDLRAAGARVGGTINDAFVAAVALGVADHHREAGAGIDRLRMSIPINTRTAGDGIGNHWTPGRLDLRVEDAGGDAMTRRVRDEVRRLRSEPGHVLLGPVAGLLRRLPGSAAAAAFTAVAGGIDIAASNVPGSPVPLHLCGREVVALVPFGPLSGAAANITLLSHGPSAHIGVVTDPAAVTDAPAFTRHLAGALTAVVKGS